MKKYIKRNIAINLSIMLILEVILIRMIPFHFINHTKANEAGVQEDAYAAYEELINSFPQSKTTGKKLYPDYYGGSYINDEGKLVIYVTDNSAVPMLFNNDNVIYEICNYSYNELTNIMNQINEFKLSGQDHFANEFNYYTLSDSENQIIVEFDELTDANIAEFKQKVSSSEAICFAQSQGNDREEVYLKTGVNIRILIKTMLSIGYRIKINRIFFQSTEK